MYKKRASEQPEFPHFHLPFNGKLDKDNKWIRLSELVPWGMVEEIYQKSLSTGQGAPALSSRIAFGSLLIQEYKNLTDRETVVEIQENPYLQYFLGYKEYQTRLPFDSSLMVHFRKRFSSADIAGINEQIILSSRRSKVDKNRGKKKHFFTY